MAVKEQARRRLALIRLSDGIAERNPEIQEVPEAQGSTGDSRVGDAKPVHERRQS